MRSFVRSFSRQPVLAAAIVVTLALGVGVATALFVYLDSFLHPRLAAPEASRVVAVYVGSAEEPRQQASYLELQRLRGNPVLHDVVPLRRSGPRSAETAPPEGGSRYAWGHSWRPLLRLLRRQSRARTLAHRRRRPKGWRRGPRPWRLAGITSVAPPNRRTHVQSTGKCSLWSACPASSPASVAVGFFVPLVHADLVSGVPRSSRPIAARVLCACPKGTTQAAAEGVISALTRSSITRRRSMARAGPPSPATRFDPETRTIRSSAARLDRAAIHSAPPSANVAGLARARASAAVREDAGARPNSSSARSRQRSRARHFGAAGGLLVVMSVARRLESMMLTPIGGIGPG